MTEETKAEVSRFRESVIGEFYSPASPEAMENIYRLLEENGNLDDVYKGMVLAGEKADPEELGVPVPQGVNVYRCSQTDEYYMTDGKNVSILKLTPTEYKEFIPPQGSVRPIKGKYGETLYVADARGMISVLKEFEGAYHALGGDEERFKKMVKTPLRFSDVTGLVNQVDRNDGKECNALKYICDLYDELGMIDLEAAEAGSTFRNEFDDESAAALSELALAGSRSMRAMYQKADARAANSEDDIDDTDARKIWLANTLNGNPSYLLDPRIVRKLVGEAGENLSTRPINAYLLAAVDGLYQLYETRSRQQVEGTGEDPREVIDRVLNQVLDPYIEASLKNGGLDPEKAREYLAETVREVLSAESLSKMERVIEKRVPDPSRSEPGEYQAKKSLMDEFFPEIPEEVYRALQEEIPEIGGTGVEMLYRKLSVAGNEVDPREAGIRVLPGEKVYASRDCLYMTCEDKVMAMPFDKNRAGFVLPEGAARVVRNRKGEISYVIDAREMKGALERITDAYNKLKAEFQENEPEFYSRLKSLVNPARFKEITQLAGDIARESPELEGKALSYLSGLFEELYPFNLRKVECYSVFQDDFPEEEADILTSQLFRHLEGLGEEKIREDVSMAQRGTEAERIQRIREANSRSGPATYRISPSAVKSVLEKGWEPGKFTQAYLDASGED